MQEIITRKQAIQRGLKLYFSGLPCPQGHVAERRLPGSTCVVCFKQFSKEWYAKNRDRKLENSKRVYLNNRENVLARTGRYQKENKKRRNEYSRKWRAENPDKVYEGSTKFRKSHLERYANYCRNRRAKEKMAEGAHGLDDVFARLKWQKGRCAACKKKLGKKYDVDHYHPISKGGSNYPSNIQILCISCNRKKCNKDPIDFYQSIGCLL